MKLTPQLQPRYSAFTVYKCEEFYGKNLQASAESQKSCKTGPYAARLVEYLNEVNDEYL